MLLVEFTVNGLPRYVSVDGHGLEHNWKPKVITFDAPVCMLPYDHGGYGRMQFGTISFNPELFYDVVEGYDDWPPPVNGAISIYYTDTTEAAAELIFTGMAHLSTFDAKSVTYALYGPSYDETIASATAYNDTLNTVITSILTSIAEINTVNTDYARAVSPNVNHIVTNDTLAIDLASEIAAFYSHLFYIIGDTAYLVDMKLDNGTDWTLTEYDYFFLAKYWYNTPIAAVYASQYYQMSVYPYGTTLTLTAYHSVQANIEAALADILAIHNAARVTISVPMEAGNFPLLGQRIDIPDNEHVADLLSYIRARKMTFDFLNDNITIEGEGEVAAA